MTQNTLTAADLRQFTGTENWYRHAIARNVLYTDGIKYVAEKAGTSWLLDEIALAQSLPHIKAEPFQRWHLQVRPNHTALLTCDDGNYNIRLSKEIEFTDFPLDEIAIYMTGSVIMLTSEY